MSAFLVVHFLSLNHNARHDLVVNETFLLMIDVLSLAFVWPSQLRGHSRSRLYPGIITAWPVILCWQGFSSTVHSQASEGSKITLLGSFPRPNVKITCASDMSKNWLPVSSNMLHWCSRYCLALCLICFSCVFCPVLLHHSADAPRFCIPKWKKQIHRLLLCFSHVTWNTLSFSVYQAETQSQFRTSLSLWLP